MVLGGLVAATPHMVAATVMALARLLYEFCGALEYLGDDLLRAGAASHQEQRDCQSCSGLCQGQIRRCLSQWCWADDDLMPACTMRVVVFR